MPKRWLPSSFSWKRCDSSYFIVRLENISQTIFVGCLFFYKYLLYYFRQRCEQNAIKLNIFYLIKSWQSLSALIWYTVHNNITVCNCWSGTCWGDNCADHNSLGGNCPSDNCPRWQLYFDNCPRWQLSRWQLP